VEHFSLHTQNTVTEVLNTSGSPVLFITSKMAKTQQEIEARYARLAELAAEGRVMDSKMRTRVANQQRKNAKLQQQAENVIAGLQASQIASNRYKDISTAEVVKEATPEANVSLPRNKTEDTLAVQASKVIQELLNS